MNIQKEILDAFTTKITECALYKKYEMKLLTKAKPSDGIGAYHGNKTFGITMYSRVAKTEREEINGLFLHGKSHRGIKQFVDALPGGISFEMSREEVHKLLGKPDWSIEKGGIGIMAVTNSADKWFTEGKEGFRVEYAVDDKSISLVSIHCAKQEAEWA